ncbi:MAG: rod shape-determining protein MreC [Muribaculaceae bacterium]|nr:rod shape-determining protein MreC [Muribaculaceae bacterium]
MNNLLSFFVKHSAWFVFMVYMILSLVLLFRDNPYQQSVYLTSANAVSATTYEALSTVTSYFHLKDINEDLQERNALLEMELVRLRSQVKDLQVQIPDSMRESWPQRFNFVMARVISNSIAQPHNYITINKGSNQGVRPQMGVVDQNGVVGVVNVVGRNASRVISLLNTDMKLSCKLKNNEYFGSLIWDGRSPEYAVLGDLPKHITFNKGDTVITSGYSALFPEGLIVGVVEGSDKGADASFASLRVKLTTNFSQLSAVRVITNNMSDELHQLERADADSVALANKDRKP